MEKKTKTKVRLVYITTPDKDTGRTLGRTLVEEKLAACVNIIEGMTSLYEWKGTLEESSETVLIAKTTKPCIPALIKKVKELHPYDCPCIMVLPIKGGNKGFLKWVRDNTQLS